MKKLIVCLMFASGFIVQANEKMEKEIIVENIENGTCTVTVTYTDSDGQVYSGSGTAETCSKAKEKALGQLLDNAKAQ